MNAGLVDCRTSPDRTLAAYLAPPADLVLLHVPLASALAASDAGLVRAVLIDGSLITGA